MDKILRQELGLGRRQAAKVLEIGNAHDRNEQFERLAELRSYFETWGFPIISIDTKKKELLGNFFRPGACYTNGQPKVFDHDFVSSGTGKVVPYGIYDVTANEGLMLLSQSADTADLATDAIECWWKEMGADRYRHATKLLIMGDCGGSNGYRLPRFRELLAALSKRIGLTIRMAHLPAYCSKYNPIEHRMFCHVHRSLRGVLFRTVDAVRQAIEATRTSTGLKVIVRCTARIYQTGLKATKAFQKNEPTRRDSSLPRYNYEIDGAHRLGVAI